MLSKITIFHLFNGQVVLHWVYRPHIPYQRCQQKNDIYQKEEGKRRVKWVKGSSNRRTLDFGDKHEIEYIDTKL